MEEDAVGQSRRLVAHAGDGAVAGGAVGHVDAAVDHFGVDKGAEDDVSLVIDRGDAEVLPVLAVWGTKRSGELQRDGRYGVRSIRVHGGEGGYES